MVLEFVSFADEFVSLCFLLFFVLFQLLEVLIDCVVECRVLRCSRFLYVDDEVFQGKEIVVYRSCFVFAARWYIASGTSAAIPKVIFLGIHLGGFKKFSILTWNGWTCFISAIQFARRH